jgi:murein L,D-transpeptidase YcbB/YkuD
MLRFGGKSCAAAMTLLVGALAAPASAEAGQWDAANVAGLRAVLAATANEGLSRPDYDGARLDQAAASGDPALAAIADETALRLAHDMFEGRLDLAHRPNWHFRRPVVDYRSWLDEVLTGHSVELSFARLLPQAPQYAQLRGALASCRKAKADCSAIEVNLDRWRALPRQFGARYLWVNVPAFRVDLVENGATVASHRVIVGKVGRKTPLFTTQVTGITANPWWNVPCSIVDESIGKLVREHPAEAAAKGYVASKDANGKLVVRQKPGPANALGKLKFEMPNPYGVYLHDTPSRDLFDKDSRALSHGCIRTDQPDELARNLLGETRARDLDLALLTIDTRTIRLPAPVPVYVVYLTAEADSAAPSGIQSHRDIYGEDSREQRAATALGGDAVRPSQ